MANNQNTVSVTLTAQDLVSPTINDLKTKLTELGANAKFSISAKDLRTTDVSKLKESMALFQAETDKSNKSAGALGVTLGNLGSSLVTAGIQGAISLVSSLSSSILGAINNASKLQTAGISTTSQIATNLGVQQKDAKDLYDKIQQQIASDAAALPGATQDYNTVFNSIAGTIAKQLVGHNELFGKVSEDITKRVGVLSAIGSVSSQDSGDIINRLLAGTSGFGEASRTALFERNPQLIGAVRDLARQYNINVDDWEKLNANTRLALLQNALRIATPDTLISQYTGTVESNWQSIVSGWFDPTSGVFGFLKKVPKLGNRTVLDSVAGFLGSLNSLSEKLISVTGTKPLEQLIGFFDYLSDETNKVNAIVSAPGSIAEKLGNLTGQAINGVSYGILEGFEKQDWEKLGEDSWDYLKYSLLSIDWSALLSGLGYLTEVPFIWAFGFIWKGLKDFVGLFKPAVDTATRWVEEAFDSINNLFSWIGKQIDKLNPFSNNVSPVVAQAVAPVQPFIDKTKEIAKPLKPAIDSVLPTVGGAVKATVDPFQPIEDLFRVFSSPGSSPNNTTNNNLNKQSSVVNNNTFNISSNASNPGEVADMVLNKISELYNSVYRSQLA